jgi:hypothetical protein
MGLNSSAQRQRQLQQQQEKQQQYQYQYQQNNMYFVDKLKSALAMNKRKNPVIILIKDSILKFYGFVCYLFKRHFKTDMLDL